MLNEDQIRSLRAVVANRHSTPVERAAAQAKLDAAKVLPAVPDPYSDDVRSPSEDDKVVMRQLLGALRDDPQPPAAAAPPAPEPAPPKVPAQTVVSSRPSGKQTNIVADVGPDDDPQALARAQELTARHARLRAQGEGLQLVHEVRLDRDRVLLLQPSDQSELDAVWGRQKMEIIECSARGSHRPKDCACLETTYQFWRDLQLRHDPESPLLLGAEHVLLPASIRFASEYRLPEAADPRQDLEWSSIWRGIYAGRRIA
jgi:hypothetical protein